MWKAQARADRRRRSQIDGTGSSQTETDPCIHATAAQQNALSGAMVINATSGGGQQTGET